MHDNPICFRCNRAFVVVKNSIKIGFVQSGTGQVDHARTGDLLACPGCNARIYARFGEPFSNLSEKEIRAIEVTVKW